MAILGPLGFAAAAGAVLAAEAGANAELPRAGGGGLAPVRTS